MARVRFFDIIKGPRMSDKAGLINKEQKKIVIDVDIKANKKDIKAAMEMLFGIQVVSVNTIRTKGKKKKSMSRYEYFESDKKKAIIKFKNEVGLDSDVNKFEQLSSSIDSNFEQQDNQTGN